MWTTTLVLSLLLTPTLLEVASPWWTSAVYYRVLVDSFKDGDGDGLGDLQGVAQKMSYVRAIGADAVILSTVSVQSDDCGRPGTVNQVELDQRYGNIDSFIAVIEKAKKLDLKVIVTLQVQTISAASEWFKLSATREPSHGDWLVWQEGTPGVVPQVEGVDEWIWHEERGAYWAASNKEALLNLCSEGVAAALSATQCAWLQRGADGVLLNTDFLLDQQCGFKLLKKLSAEAMGCARGDNMNTPIILVETALAPDLASKYYSNGGIGANSVLSKALTSPNRSSTAQLALAVYADLLNTPQDMYPTWTTSSANGNRLTTRYGRDLVDAINLLTLILPGAAVIQQGDELGAADTLPEWISSTDRCWPTQPRPWAAPFPWEASPNAGFTAGEPWLPLAPNYRYANAKTEYNNNYSHFSALRVAAAMRKSPAMGPHADIKRIDGALAVLRWAGSGSLLVISNLAQQHTEVQLSRIPGLPAEMTVATCSAGSGFSTGTHVSVERSFNLAPGETVMLAGGPRHCGGPGPVDKIANKLSEGWQKINKYFGNL